MTRRQVHAGSLSDRSVWTPVSTGESGAIVLRHVSGGRFAKIVSVADTAALEAERRRVNWLSETDIPGATVLDWITTEDNACLITSAVDGVPADRLDPAQLAEAWRSIVDTVHQLHRIPANACPFDRTLSTMMALARTTVAESRVHLEFLPQALVNTPPAEILDSLERDLPEYRTQEDASTVVCHGDLCLPNILIDPDTALVSGIIDLGRLGCADPYADIALLLANARETWSDDVTARRADYDFAARYGITLDPDRMDFYLRLDPLTW